jgi:hypothetical protein
LKGRVPRYRNEAFISHRNAAAEIGSSKTMISGWFDELEHYGFIVQVAAGCLGVDGKGKSPRWRLTELGATSKASANGLFEPPTNDFLKWDGTKFKNRIPHQKLVHLVPAIGTPPPQSMGRPEPKVSTRLVHRRGR